MPTPEILKQVVARATELHSNEQIDKAIDVMAKKITEELQDSNPVILCVMIGGVVLTGQLLTRLDCHLQVDYIHATRYQGKTVGSELVWINEPKIDLKNRAVLVVDDILDGGITLAEIIKYCQNKGASVVKCAVLVDKITSRDKDGLATADYTGIRVEDRYVYGYGMDYKGYLRNAPGIYAVAEQDQ